MRPLAVLGKRAKMAALGDPKRAARDKQSEEDPSAHRLALTCRPQPRYSANRSERPPKQRRFDMPPPGANKQLIGMVAVRGQ